jgi:hypothetical protein
MDEWEFFATLRDLEWDIFSQIPFAGFWVSGKDFEVDSIAIWTDICYTSILRPSDLSKSDQPSSGDMDLDIVLATSTCTQLINPPCESFDGRCRGDSL